MDLRQLRHFVAVAQDLHFSKAAQRINIVQSALSSSVAALEQELGVRLFYRTTRQVRLTPAGEALFDKAQIALVAMHDAQRAVEAVRDLQTGSLMIGTTRSLSALVDLPGVLADFHDLYPGIDVRLRQGSRHDLAGQVLSGQLELAFVSSMEVPRRLETRVVVDEPLVLACAPGHHLVERDAVTLSDLVEETFVDFQPGWGTRYLIDANWEGPGERRISFEVGDLDTQLALVARGLGVALVPRRNVRQDDAALCAVPLRHSSMRWRMLALYRPDPDGAVSAFLDLPALAGEPSSDGVEHEDA